MATEDAEKQIGDKRKAQSEKAESTQKERKNDA